MLGIYTEILKSTMKVKRRIKCLWVLKTAPVIYLKSFVGVGLALFLEAYLRYHYICYRLNYVIYDIDYPLFFSLSFPTLRSVRLFQHVSTNY